MKPFYSEETIAKLADRYRKIGPKAEALTLRVMAYKFKTDKGREYALRGFCRRVSVLQQCIRNVFVLIEPQKTEVPGRSFRKDAEINIQAFVANCYGAVDNLAWVISFEKELNLDKRAVGLRQHNKELLATLSPELRAYLAGLTGWFEYLVDYRDALAHRIPLYIPPGNVPKEKLEDYNGLVTQMNAASAAGNFAEYDRLSAKQEALLVFRPWISHSLDEQKGIPYFHPQLLSDFLTVEEVGSKVLEELQAAK